MLRVEDSALLPSALSPQPSASTSISCDNLQTEDQLASPPRPGSSSTPAPPRPRPGPSCRRPRQSVIPRALLSALGPSGQIKPLSHTPRKAQGQMGRDKWCQIIDPRPAWTREGPDHSAAYGCERRQGGPGRGRPENIMEER